MRSSMRFGLIFSLAAIAPLSVAHAGNTDTDQASKGYSQKYAACIQSAGSNAQGADACMSNELAYQNDRLNKAYKELLDNVKSDAKQALIDAERSWVQSRSKDAAFEASLYGSGQSGNAQQLKSDLGDGAGRSA
jgi:uncharacterized protein YecT (DUF1311 family)